jgi:DNA-binding Xre family transcriptional regulator
MESIVARNIKRILNEKGLKQGAFATQAGIDPKSFNNMLNGRKLIIDIDIARICAAAKITPNEIFAISKGSE